jgi:hypothetical protein
MEITIRLSKLYKNDLKNNGFPLIIFNEYEKSTNCNGL